MGTRQGVHSWEPGISVSSLTLYAVEWSQGAYPAVLFGLG